MRLDDVPDGSSAGDNTLTVWVALEGGLVCWKMGREDAL
jgi:hypothetical protein